MIHAREEFVCRGDVACECGCHGNGAILHYLGQLPVSAADCTFSAEDKARILAEGAKPAIPLTGARPWAMDTAARRLRAVRVLELVQGAIAARRHSHFLGVDAFGIQPLQGWMFNAASWPVRVS
jgi:hypothetical protein